MANKKDFTNVYSYSKISRFENCPKSYYFNYLDPEWKGFQKPADYKTKGSAIHGALTLFYNLKPEERNLNNLKDSLRNAWFSDTDVKKEPPLAEAGGFENIEHERKVYWESLKMLEKFFNMGDIEPPLFYMPTKNIKYSFCDYEEMIQPINDSFSISGKFDRIDKLKDGSLRIIDFKTGNKSKNKAQLDFYKILAEMNFEIPVSLVSFYYLKTAEIVDFPISNHSASEKIKKQVIEKLEKIKNTKEFEPNPTRLCDYCDFKPVCPVFNQGAKIDRIA
ncbi:MAG: PD-(D/E)XK nuclease family protein [Candidatus Pacebacteria bacterium]|nr:PD-(D/E)XK nuclease family protein [Candidatus Paceibacterota bacterium]